MDHPRPIAIVGGNRIPFARAGGKYAGRSNLDLLSAALAGLVARHHLAGEVIEVVAGAVLRHAADTSLAREALLSTQLDPASPGMDVSRACATSADAAGILADQIALGRIEAGIAAGVDSASDIPVEIGPVGPVLARARRAKGAARAKALLSLRPRHLVPVLPALAEPRTGLTMGEHQELSNERWKIARADQDELAAASHERLAKAWDRGFFDDLVTDYGGLDIDENLRETSAEKLSRLSPAFGGTMTAGTSSGLTDGAACVLLASEDWARERDLPVLARLVDYERGAVDFVGGEGLLTAPMMLAPRLLARHGLTLDDVDLVEIHEAFAATVLMTLAAWEDEEWCRSRLGLPGAFGQVDRDRLNVTGSSIATGHPFAATGARILATAAQSLAERGGRRALITICAAGGQGSAVLLEAAS